MNELDRWIGQVRAALDLTAMYPDEQKVVLDLARDVAHDVLRPAAPVSAYLLGLAVGRGADPTQAAATISDLAASWSAGRSDGERQPSGEE